jgi:hypothetical protein
MTERTVKEVHNELAQLMDEFQESENRNIYCDIDGTNASAWGTPAANSQVIG